MLMQGYQIPRSYAIKLLSTLHGTKFDLALTQWSLGVMSVILKSIIFKLIMQISSLCLLWNGFQVKAAGPHYWQVNIIGSGNGLVPSGNKPLPEPMLTKISATICRNKELTQMQVHLLYCINKSQFHLGWGLCASLFISWSIDLDGVLIELIFFYWKSSISSGYSIVATCDSIYQDSVHKMVLILTLWSLCMGTFHTFITHRSRVHFTNDMLTRQVL